MVVTPGPHIGVDIEEWGHNGKRYVPFASQVIFDGRQCIDGHWQKKKNSRQSY